MPITPTYPGVYIEEIASEVRTITGVATSITAFVGRALRGPVNEAVRIASFADYERTFGSLWVKSSMSYAVQQFFLNGGSVAVIVRVANTASPAELGVVVVDREEITVPLVAVSPGTWGNFLRAEADADTFDADLPAEDRDPSLFNLKINELADVNDVDSVINSEVFRNVSISDSSPRYVNAILQQSKLVRVGTDPVVIDAGGDVVLTSGTDGDAIHSLHVVGDGTPSGASQADKTGLYALEDTDLFNLLCIPPYVRAADSEGLANYSSRIVDDEMKATYTAALAYCITRRAMLLVDPLDTWTETSEVDLSELELNPDKHAAVFFPRIVARDSVLDNRLEPFAPSGAMAGIFSRTDASRGVWKAPAGIEASINGAAGLTYKLTDDENGVLNPLGVNCLRSFPVIGRVLWGSRTMAGADRLASEWKYIPVRRLALFIEETLFRGTQWVVFEPNDEPLWAQIRLNLGAFMQNLFRQGAFQGSSPADAYFVKCDKETTTQNDIDRGIVNIVVGFAPLKPAEFVIIKLQQIAAQSEA